MPRAHFACLVGKLSNLEKLLENDRASVNEKAKMHGNWMPIDFAIVFGHKHIVDYLISNYYDVDTSQVTRR